MLCSYKNHRIRSTDGHLQCFSRKHYSSWIHQSASALNRSIHPPGNSQNSVVREKAAERFKGKHYSSINRDKKAIFHVFLPILTLLFPHSTILNISRGRGGTHDCFCLGHLLSGESMTNIAHVRNSKMTYLLYLLIMW